MIEVDARPAVYVEGDKVIYRGSKLGLCLRALTAARLGMPWVPPGEKQLADMQAGKDHETVILHLLRRLGEASHEQAEVCLDVAPGIVVRAHLDAKTTCPERVVEMKALAPSSTRVWRTKAFAAFPAWAWQLSAAMHATSLPGAMAVVQRGVGQLHLSDYPAAPHSLAAVRERIGAVERQAKAGDLGECPGSYPCPAFYLHDDCPTFTPERTPEHVRGILREAYESATGAYRERVAKRLEEAGLGCRLPGCIRSLNPRHTDPERFGQASVGPALGQRLAHGLSAVGPRLEDCREGPFQGLSCSHDPGE